MRHFRSDLDLSPEEMMRVIEAALRLKREPRDSANRRQLPGRVLGLMFEKPSMRTRVSFESAVAHLGGACVFMTREEVALGQRETIADFARVISRYVDWLAVRTFAHEVVEELAKYASCPVINALSDYLHPCQALADLCTIQEHFGRLAGIRMVFVGDGNNVSRSLALASLQCGLDFVLCSPPGFEFNQEFMAKCKTIPSTGSVSLETDASKAVRGADVVYTDVWTSMGQEEEQAQRKLIFADYQVNAKLLAIAKPTVRFLHCLPAHRGEEVTSDVLDGPASLIVEQAANRLHAQKSLLLWLFSHSAS
ncbi:MAG: ornithine carbamoyltransferase [Planctomycetota bacterium]